MEIENTTSERKICRNRVLYIAFFIITIAAGLLSRSKYVTLPQFFADYSGDTIWAMMVYFLICSVFTKWRTRSVFVMAIAFSYAIEFSQLYHAPWIDHIRHYRLGGLVLGFGFKFSDLICYTAGITLAALIDTQATKRATKG